MKKTFTFILVILCFSFIVRAQKEGLNFIRQDHLKTHMTFFASDDLEGREIGCHGNDVAAHYIEKNIKTMGLRPIPETGNYCQPISIVSKKIIKKDTYLKITSSEGKEILFTDSLATIFTPTNTLDVTGNVVFVGYGYQNAETGYDDLQGVDLKDKIVLLMTRNPEMVLAGSGNNLFDYNVEFPKLNPIVKSGAKAVLYVYDPEYTFPDVYTSGYAELVGADMLSIPGMRARTSNFQYSFITRNAADLLLKPTGLTLAQLQEKINKQGKPVSVELQGLVAEVKTSVETTEFVANNVIGIIEGSDPELKDECIIYTAHFDHEGIGDNGEVFNGADDNASGSMALLEVAKAFMNMNEKPLRTIVFAWMNGEEKGMLGSKYYVDNPIVPLDKTLLDINLDMIGRSKLASDTGLVNGFELTVTNSGEILVYSALKSNELTQMLASAAEESSINVINKGADSELGTSDHSVFLAKDVPAVFFTSGVHADLHTFTDDIDKIDFDKMEKASKMVFLLGYKIVNQKEKLQLK